MFTDSYLDNENNWNDSLPDESGVNQTESERSQEELEPLPDSKPPEQPWNYIGPIEPLKHSIE